MRYWTAQMVRADALLFGRVTYEMMAPAWRKPATGTWPDWMDEWQFPKDQAPARAGPRLLDPSSFAMPDTTHRSDFLRGATTPGNQFRSRLLHDPSKKAIVQERTSRGPGPTLKPV